MPETVRLAAIAARALPLVDLTDLGDTCTPAAVDALVDRAATAFGPVAAVCLWPRFVARARSRLDPASPIRIATVVNFPDGGTDLAAVVAETEAALRDGADEIDLVLPYRALMAGDAAAAERMIAAVRALFPPPPVSLKVILETGRLADPALIRQAADLAIAAGADFIKTSTGKVDVNATPEAAEIMLQAIWDAGRPCGFKAAGGIRTTEDAGRYLDIADRILGPDWASPATFRFGASGLLDDLLARLGGGTAAAGQPASY
ncbi:deoxyribose-phosphate aldolase [Prosthecodimorpha staleyi]|uniref:Deoxyribose-phosphate aldolase n=1 Tax=Prosthecodimorpha staleyi TaxID=2840188 RepID=A0A947DA64_9HYPH|nr:deoxyribose-phosphate aldolase [Prosthecodimorpha staleyi]MBT9291262.1 deoxyribose-phosphate aldolase [Prosthecodimorpha staleyi]